MEEESGAASRYYCHMCSLIIRPELGIEEVKCPHCHTGFVEEMAGDQRGSGDENIRGRDAGEASVNASDAALEREFLYGRLCSWTSSPPRPAVTASVLRWLESLLSSDSCMSRRPESATPAISPDLICKAVALNTCSMNCLKGDEVT